VIGREVARFDGSRMVINLATLAAGGRWIEVREDGDYAVGDPAERWN
jgi:hypothetical protein